MLGKIKIRRRSEGFTLIEMLISIVIFVMFLGIVSQSYVSIVRAQRQANEVRKMYSDVRNFMDFFAEEVRLSAIDYECYGGNTRTPSLSVGQLGSLYCDDVTGGSLHEGKTQYLALIKKGGREKTFIKFEDGRLLVRKHVKGIEGTWGAAPGYEGGGLYGYLDVFSAHLEVESLTFAIFPDVNPYSDDSAIYSDNGTQFQPKVTMFLSVQNSEEVQTDFDYDFQTTISSRVYSRQI